MLYLGIRRFFKQKKQACKHGVGRVWWRGNGFPFCFKGVFYRHEVEVGGQWIIELKL